MKLLSLLVFIALLKPSKGGMLSFVLDNVSPHVDCERLRSTERFITWDEPSQSSRSIKALSVCSNKVIKINKQEPPTCAMAPVLSFIHVVIVHINFHHPSYASYYRAYHHRRDGEPRHSSIPRSCLHARPIASLSLLFYLQLDKAAALASIHPLSTATIANCVPLFKEFTSPPERKPEPLHINAPDPKGPHNRKGKDTSLPLICDLVQLLPSLAYPPRFKKQSCILDKHPDDQVSTATSYNLQAP